MALDMSLDALQATILTHFPELGAATFTLLAAGWDSVAVDADDCLIFKFPRDETARLALIREASILAAVRPALAMPVPELALFEAPRLFSRHRKIRGEHLVTAQYALVPTADRDRMAAELALFYSQLHAIDSDRMALAGARPIGKWLEPEEILRRSVPLLPSQLQAYAERTINAWQDLPPDPHGITYGFYDGHGWNMAFDHARNRLVGIYDFADSGFGDLQQEFIYSNFVARDLTERIIIAYEALTGRVIDRERVELLSGVLRLSELAEMADDPERHQEMIGFVADWAGLPQ